jgi:hypothetical protein
MALFFMELFKPAWQKKDAYKAIRAVNAMTDHKKLIRVVQEAPIWKVRIAAVEKLTDQSVLSDVAKNGKNSDTSQAAVKKLTDQSVLAEVAKDAQDWKVRRIAIEKLDDQSALVEIAKNDKEADVRESAVEKLTDQTVLTDIAWNDGETSNVRLRATVKLADQSSLQTVYAGIATDSKALLPCRAEAIEMLTDQATLAVLAKSDRKLFLWEKALQKVSDQDALADIAKNGMFSELRIKAVRKLTNETALADVAKNDEDRSVSQAAVEKLDDQSGLADIAKDGKSGDVRKMAVNKLTDQSALVDVAKNGNDGFVGIAAIEMLTDQTLAPKLYACIANHGKYIYNGKYDEDFAAQIVALNRLANQTVIAEVAKNAKYGKVRIEAMRKCGLICEESNHHWISTDQCHKKCTVCGVGAYSHNYVETYYDGSGAEVSYSRYRCTQCGLEGASGYGSSLLTGYFYDHLL